MWIRRFPEIRGWWHAPKLSKICIKGYKYISDYLGFLNPDFFLSYVLITVFWCIILLVTQNNISIIFRIHWGTKMGCTLISHYIYYNISCNTKTVVCILCLQNNLLTLNNQNHASKLLFPKKKISFDYYFTKRNVLCINRFSCIIDFIYSDY